MEAREKAGILISAGVIAAGGIALLCILWISNSEVHRAGTTGKSAVIHESRILTKPPLASSTFTPATPASPALLESDENVRRQQRARYNLACSLFNEGQYEQASDALSSLLTSHDADLGAKAAQLKRDCDFHRQIAADLPLPTLIQAHIIPINERPGKSRVMVQRGLVKSLGILAPADSPSGPHTCTDIQLYNPTEGRVKPDVQIMLLNKDGVILLEHSESWLFSTLDSGQSYIVRVDKCTEFPATLVFSKWGFLGWDIKPAYAVCVGSKTSCDSLRNDLAMELKRVRTAPPLSVCVPYKLTDVLPEVQPFSFDNVIPIANSDIVESVMFAGAEVHLNYFNRTDMRVQPDIVGHVFNSDGVIIGSFSDTWVLLELGPGERKTETKSVSFYVPDELMYSRWAAAAYDEKPAWFLVTGPSKKFQALVKRAETHIRELNTATALKE